LFCSGVFADKEFRLDRTIGNTGRHAAGNGQLDGFIG
jgi:hypothetical protein